MPKIDRNMKCSSKHLAMSGSSGMLLSKLSLLLLLLLFAIHLCLLSIFITIKKQKSLKLNTKFELRCVAKAGSYINICKPSGSSFRQSSLCLLLSSSSSTSFSLLLLMLLFSLFIVTLASSLTGDKASQKSL